MTRHAKYIRSLVLWDADTCQPKEETMEILRLKCRSCGTTHSVLTLDIIPFFSFSIQALLALVFLCIKGSVPKTAKNTGVSYQTLYFFLMVFDEYKSRLTLFLREEDLLDDAATPDDRKILSLLEGKAPPWLQSAFFRRQRHPIFLHRHSTVSYPLLFLPAFPDTPAPT